MTHSHLATCIGFAGSSITYSGTGYRVIAQNDLPRRYKRCIFTFKNISNSGFATWSNLINFSGLRGSDLVMFDTVQDDPQDMPHVEAFIRKLWAIDCAVIGTVFFAVADEHVNDNVNHPVNQASITPYLALLTYYGVPYVNFLLMCQGWVNGGLYNLDDLLADTVHPTVLGHQLVYHQLRRYLPFDGAYPPTTLPARFYAASADFEQAPVIKNGTDYNSRAGVWVDSGNHTASATPGSTITYSGTFRSIGIFNAITSYPVVSIIIDGGAPINPFNIYPNGYDIGVRAAHTIEITVLTTVTIDEFWAI